MLFGTLSLHRVDSIMHLLKLLANGRQNLQDIGVLLRARLHPRKLDFQLLRTRLCRCCLCLELDKASCSVLCIFEAAGQLFDLCP